MGSWLSVLASWGHMTSSPCGAAEIVACQLPSCIPISSRWTSGFRLTLSNVDQYYTSVAYVSTLTSWCSAIDCVTVSRSVLSALGEDQGMFLLVLH